MLTPSPNGKVGGTTLIELPAGISDLNTLGSTLVLRLLRLFVGGLRRPAVGHLPQPDLQLRSLLYEGHPG